MIKLLLKKVYTSSSSRGSLGVDTCVWEEGEGQACPCHTGWGGFIFGERQSKGSEQSRGQEVSWQHKRLSYTSGAYAVLSITPDSLQASGPEGVGREL